MKIFQSIFCILLITTCLISQTKADLPAIIKLDEFSCQDYATQVTQDDASENPLYPIKNSINLLMWMEGAAADSMRILPAEIINGVHHKVLRECNSDQTFAVFAVYQAEREKLLADFDQKKVENASFDIAEPFCEEALDKSRNFLKGTIVFIFWIDGFVAKENVIDFNNIEMVIQQAEKECRQNPKKPIFNVVQQIILTN